MSAGPERESCNTGDRAKASDAEVHSRILAGEDLLISLTATPHLGSTVALDVATGLWGSGLQFQLLLRLKAICPVPP